MNKQNRESSHHFNAYYQDNGLLLQFIVTELIHIHPLIIQITALVQEHLHPKCNADIPFADYVSLLGLLVGNLSSNDRDAFPRWTKGYLTKLKEYCEQLSYNSKHQDKQQVNLHIAIHQSWMAALHNLELLNALVGTEITTPKKRRLLQTFKKNVHTLQTRFNQALRHLPGTFKGHLKNENVLLCLMRKKAQLTEIYGSDFLYKKLKCPVKPDQFIDLLVTRFKERGFDQVPAEIEQIAGGEFHS